MHNAIFHLSFLHLTVSETCQLSRTSSMTRTTTPSITSVAILAQVTGLTQNATKEQRATVTVGYTYSSLDFDDDFTFAVLNNIPFYAVYASNLSSETITSLSPWTLVEANHHHPPTSVVG